MNKMKTEWNVKATYTERIITHVPIGWGVNITFACGGVFNLLNMYPAKELYGVRWRWGKVIVWNISTAGNDKTYWCIAKKSLS